jgi:hypothetical protein
MCCTMSLCNYQGSMLLLVRMKFVGPIMAPPKGVVDRIQQFGRTQFPIEWILLTKRSQGTSFDPILAASSSLTICFASP